MEISYVQPGEKITAQGYNALVDAVGGAGNYSAEGFQNEKNGTTLWNRANLSMKYFNGAWRTMFQVVEATYWKQTARGQWNPPNKTKTLLIDLGSDADALKANVTVMGQQVENAAVIVGDSPSMDSEINDALYKNASNNKAQWVDLGIDPEYTSFIAGDFFKEVTEEGEGDDKNKVTKYYFAVTDKSENDVIDRAKQIFGIQGDDFKLIKRFILSKKGDASIGSDIKNYVQAHTGVLSYSTPTPDGMISVDSDIVDLMLSSIEKLSVEYQISGISGDVQTEVGDAYSFWNFDKAQRISLWEALDKEKSNKQSAPSCRVDVVLRIGKADNSVSAPTMVDYLELSTLVTSCDTNFYNKNPKEMKSTSLQWTYAEKGQPVLEIKGFKDEGSVNPPQKYNLLIRQTTDDDDKILKYIEPTDLILVDSEITSIKRNSLEKKTDPADAKKKYVQLYKFDDPGYTVLSVDKYTKKLPEGYKLVVRHDKGGEGGNAEVEYCDFNIDVQNMSADSEFEAKTKSIDADRIDNYFRLHNFSEAGTNETFTPKKANGYRLPDTGKEILYRDGNELKYCNADFTTLVNETLSSAQNLYKADSDFPDEKLSSLERRENTQNDPNDPEKKLKRQEFSMYQFNQADYKMSRSQILNDSTVLMREKLTGGQTILRYVDLSSFEESISGDVAIDQSGKTQKSIDFKHTVNDPKQKYAQLYNFDSTTADVTIDLKNKEQSGDKYHFLVKKVSDGKLNELQYADVSAVLSAEVDDKSIEVNAENKKFQLKYFDQDSYNNITLSGGQWFDLNGTQCLVGKNLQTGEINYYTFKVDLSANQLCADTRVIQDGNYDTQSIDEAYSQQDKVHYHRLHNFDLDSALEKNEWEDTMHVLVRQKDQSNLTLEYIKLTDLSGQQLSVDSEIQNSTKSIEKTDDVLRLYNFGTGNTDLTVALGKGNPQTLSSINVLVREGTELKYAALSIDFANGKLSSDSQIGSIQQKSIETKHSDDLSTDYFQLHKFDQGSRDVTLSIGNDNRELPAGYSILVRRTTDQGDTVLDYANLSIGLSGEQLQCDDKSTEINPVSKKLQIYGFQDISHTTITLDRQNPVVNKDDYRFITKDKAHDNITQTVLSIKFDEPISVDTACDNFDSNSLEAYYSQEKAANVIKINGFDDKQNEEVDVVSADVNSYDVLMRHHTAGGAIDTAYLNVAALLSTNVQLSCDSQGTTNKKSIAYNAAGELELYNFDKITTDLTVSHSPAGYTPNTQLVLTKNTNNGQLQYARLYTNTRTDTSCDAYSNSIEYSGQYNAIKINGWNTKANTAASTVSANVGNYDVLMRRHNGSYYYTEYMNIAPLLSGGAMPEGETTDLTVITQVVWDTSSHKIQPKGKVLKFVNGLLSSVGQEQNVGGINTTPWTGE